jgi:L-lactate dehydrogenase complex protein LldE
VGFAAASLIEAAGCEVVVPGSQTCCGQPAYNAGEIEKSRAIAKTAISAFETCDYVVAPSGSCAAMLKRHVARLLSDDPRLAGAALSFAGRVHELTSFLVNVRGMTKAPGRFKGRVAYHDACSAKRELGIEREPRLLLASIHGLELVEPDRAEECCGFGGLFSIEYADISSALAVRKAGAIRECAPDLVVGPDLGCLMSIAGTLSRQGVELACRHVAEVLAGELTAPPIGQTTGLG